LLDGKLVGDSSRLRMVDLMNMVSDDADTVKWDFTFDGLLFHVIYFLAEFIGPVPISSMYRSRSGNHNSW